MTETIEYEQFEQTGDDGQPVPGSASEVDLSRLSDIPMELSVEIGRTHMTVGETLDLCVGSVVTLERLAGEAADLLVNGTAIARGEVVVIDEQYGLRITEILDGQPDPELLEPAARAAAAAEIGVEGGEQAAPEEAAAEETAAEHAVPEEDAPEQDVGASSAGEG